MVLFCFMMGCSSLLEQAQESCYASCDTQQQGCSSLDRKGCYGLCDWVIATIEEKEECLHLGIEGWKCDSTMHWVCSSQTDIVGEPIENTCADTQEQFGVHGCIESLPSFP